MRNTRMIELNKNGIYYLSDLLNIESLTFFNEQLLSHWNNILMYDYTINEKNLNIKDLADLRNYKNPRYWNGLKSNQRHRAK